MVSKLNFPDRLQGRMNFEIGFRLNLLSEERRLAFISCRDMKRIVRAYRLRGVWRSHSVRAQKLVWKWALRRKALVLQSLASDPEALSRLRD